LKAGPRVELRAHRFSFRTPIASTCRRQREGRLLIRRLLLVAFFVEAGLLLLVLPWSKFWETNYFASIWPRILPLMTNDYVRGAVSGIGLINLCAGILELAAIFTLRDVPISRAAIPDVNVSGPYPNTADRIEP
jgi:ABC-type transport system involved in cytochrome c biogenesis permease subunit